MAPKPVYNKATFADGSTYWRRSADGTLYAGCWRCTIKLRATDAVSHIVRWCVTQADVDRQQPPRGMQILSVEVAVPIDAGGINEDAREARRAYLRVYNANRRARKGKT